MCGRRVSPYDPRQPPAQVRFYLDYLRNKLEQGSRRPEYFLAYPGVGHLSMPAEEAAESLKCSPLRSLSPLVAFSRSSYAFLRHLQVALSPFFGAGS
jgi:hypothetical protein